MRIAVLTRRFDPAGGGTERDLMVTLPMLARAGHEAVVYADEVRARVAGVEVRRVGAAPLPRTLAFAWFAYAAPSAARRDGADLVLSFARTIGADIVRSGGGAHVSYVRAARLWRGTLRAQAMRLEPYHRTQMLVERLGLRSRRLKRVIAVSNLVRDDLVRTFGVPANRAVTLYNGVDLERFRPAISADRGAEFRTRYGIPTEAPLAVFVGNGFARKGLGVLLEAIPAMANNPYLIVVGNDRLRAAYERKAARLGIHARVLFTGVQPDAEHFFQAADAFAFPSLFEPFGNVALEAMACATPALVSSACGVAELMPPELRSAIVQNPADPNEIARGMDAILAARGALGPIALATAREFTWERHERELRAIIESVAAEL